MRKIVGAAITLIIGVLAMGMQNDNQTKAQRQTAPTKRNELLTAARYFGLNEPREWTYEVTFDTTRIYYFPYIVKPAGLVTSNVTHGLMESKSRSLTFSIKTSGSYDDQPLSVALDDAGKLFWSAASVCESKFVLVRSGSGLPGTHPWSGKGRDDDGQWKPFQPFSTELLGLELRITLCSKDNKPTDFVVSEILGIIPVDTKSRISRYGWASAPAVEPITVPAGKYSRLIYSKFPRGNGQEAPEHVVETWVAEGIGLVKYRVTEKGAPVYTVALKSVRKTE